MRMQWAMKERGPDVPTRSGTIGFRGNASTASRCVFEFVSGSHDNHRGIWACEKSNHMRQHNQTTAGFLCHHREAKQHHINTMTSFSATTQTYTGNTIPSNMNRLDCNWSRLLSKRMEATSFLSDAVYALQMVIGSRRMPTNGSMYW
jgi:hypothetical protein